MFSAAPDEIAALRSVLEKHEDASYDALSILPRGLLWDTLDVLGSEGHAARVSFIEGFWCM